MNLTTLEQHSLNGRTTSTPTSSTKMSSLQVTIVEAVFSAMWLIETFILMSILFFIIDELCNITSAKSFVSKLLVTTLDAHVSVLRLYHVLNIQLRSGCASIVLVLQTCLSIKNLHKSCIRNLEPCCQVIKAKSQKVQRLSIFFSISCFYCVHQSVYHLTSWASGLPARLCQRRSATATHHTQQPDGDDDDKALPDLQFAHEHYIQVPTTHIEGVFSTATLHKAYSILLASSVRFYHLKPATRSAIICRIAHDIVNYSNDVGHIWSMRSTFALAAQVLRYQFDADWFERSLQLQAAGSDSSLVNEDSDIMATFIAIVFVVTCGLPGPAHSISCAVGHMEAAPAHLVPEAEV